MANAKAGVLTPPHYLKFALNKWFFHVFFIIFCKKVFEHFSFETFITQPAEKYFHFKNN